MDVIHGSFSCSFHNKESEFSACIFILSIHWGHKRNNVKSERPRKEWASFRLQGWECEAGGRAGTKRLSDSHYNLIQDGADKWERLARWTLGCKGNRGDNARPPTPLPPLHSFPSLSLSPSSLLFLPLIIFLLLPFILLFLLFVFLLLCYSFSHLFQHNVIHQQKYFLPELQWNVRSSFSWNDEDTAFQRSEETGHVIDSQIHCINNNKLGGDGSSGSGDRVEGRRSYSCSSGWLVEAQEGRNTRGSYTCGWGHYSSLYLLIQKLHKTGKIGIASLCMRLFSSTPSSPPLLQPRLLHFLPFKASPIAPLQPSQFFLNPNLLVSPLFPSLASLQNNIFLHSLS